MIINLLPLLLAFFLPISAEIQFPSGPFKEDFQDGLKFIDAIEEILNTSNVQRESVETNLRSMLNCENKVKYEKLDRYILHLPSGFGSIGKSPEQVKKVAEDLGVFLEGLEYMHMFYCRDGNRMHGTTLPPLPIVFTAYGAEIFLYVDNAKIKFDAMYSPILTEAPQEEKIVNALVDKYMTCLIEGEDMCEQVINTFGTGIGTYRKTTPEISDMYRKAGILCSMLKGVAKFRPCNNNICTECKWIDR